MANVKYTDEFPFIYQALDDTSNPGWADLSDVFPTVVGSPAADEAEVRIVSAAPAGTYVFGVSAAWSVNSNTNSIQTRISFDGGATWEIFSRGSSDSDDRQALTHSFPKIQGVGGFDFVAQFRKENAVNQMSLVLGSIWYERVK